MPLHLPPVLQKFSDIFLKTFSISTSLLQELSSFQWWKPKFINIQKKASFMSYDHFKLLLSYTDHVRGHLKMCCISFIAWPVTLIFGYVMHNSKWISKKKMVTSDDLWPWYGTFEPHEHVKVPMLNLWKVTSLYSSPVPRNYQSYQHTERSSIYELQSF